MFDLEQSIAEWRRQMLTAGLKSPVPLDELECHLREDVANQVQAGADAQQAFVAAVRRMGDARVLKTEFVKAREIFSHDRIYTTMLAVMGIYFAAGCGLFLWLTQVSATAGPLGLGYTPEWSLPWQAVLAFAYAAATATTFLARLVKPEAGQRWSRILNWALLPIIPFGTLIGVYGMWKADKGNPGSSALSRA